MNFVVSMLQTLKSAFQFRRLVSVFLILVLTSNPILAMPQGIIGIGNDLSYSLAFYWYNTGLAAKFKAWFQKPTTQGAKGWDGKGAPPGRKPSKPQAQETQEERNAKIVSVEVFPKAVTVAPGAPLILQAVAKDAAGNVVSGTKSVWSGISAEDGSVLTEVGSIFDDKDETDGNPGVKIGKGGKVKVTGNAKAAFSQKGEFVAASKGLYRMVARLGAQQAQINVTVKGTLPNPNRKETVGPPSSSRDLPQVRGTKIGAAPAQRLDEGFRSRRLLNSWKNLLSGKPSYSSTATAMFQGGYGYGDPLGWNDGNAYSADDTGKERGNIPGHSVNSGVGSGNYQFDIPLVSLDGRGMDLKLEMEYNARVWHKTYNYWANANQVTFDIDRDWPAPGFNLGFGKLINMGNDNYYATANKGYILVDNDGTRHPYAGVSSTVYYPPNTNPYDAP